MKYIKVCLLFAPMLIILTFFVAGAQDQLADERNTEPGRLDLIYHPSPVLSEYLVEIDSSLTTWIE